MHAYTRFNTRPHGYDLDYSHKVIIVGNKKFWIMRALPLLPSRKLNATIQHVYYLFFFCQQDKN